MTQKSLQLPKTSQPSSKFFRDLRERVIEFVLFLAAFTSVATTIAIIFILLRECWDFFQQVSLVEFLTGTVWSPLIADVEGNFSYGILPLLSGTLVTTAVALLVAVPLGTIAAIYLSEFAKPQLREIVKPILELLAGVPTVVYGYFALLFVTPLLQKFFSDWLTPLLQRFNPNIYIDLPYANMLSAGLVMGIMIIPYVSSLSEDAMRAVPVHLREGSYAMGGTRLQTAVRVILPAAISGISASYILGISRAVGETMVVAIAAGGQPNLTWNPIEPAQTITAYIVAVSLGDLPYGSIEYQTIFAAGITLVLMTLCFNVIGHILRKRYREVY